MRKIIKELRLDVCSGSKEGIAIYINDKDGGSRIFGGKCWGEITPIFSFILTTQNIDNAIAELKKARKALYKHKGPCRKCEDVKRGVGSTWWCPARKWTQIYLEYAKPVKACRDAEVK
jgi:hypothetical protein